MKVRRKLPAAVLVLLIVAALMLRTSAASSATVKVAGDAQFISIDPSGLPSGAAADGHAIHLGFRVVESEGVLSGQGALIDRDYPMRAVLTFTGQYRGSGADPDAYPHDYQGTARLYDHRTCQGCMYFRLYLTHGNDGGVKRVGLILGDDPDDLTPAGGAYFAWPDTWQGAIDVHQQ